MTAVRLFGAKKQFKAAHHAHTSNTANNGRDPLLTVIRDHYDRDFDILAITDHNLITRHWTTSPNGPSPEQFDEFATGEGRGGRKLLMIPNTIEQSWRTGRLEHINTFLVDYVNNTDMEALLTQTWNGAGLAHFNHIRRTIGGSQVGNAAQINRYVDLFARHRFLVATEIINSPLRYPESNPAQTDRVMWDNINRGTIPQGRFIWGVCNDDSHQSDEIDWAYNVMVMRDNTVSEFRNAMLTGRFYAVTRLSPMEGVNNSTRDTVAPVINEIEVNGSTITISAENYSRIDWIGSESTTAPVTQGATIDLHGVPGVGSFIRANVIGAGGVAFTQPLGHVVDGEIARPEFPRELGFGFAS